MAMERVRMQIEGMTCAHCVRAVEAALGTVAGVQVEQVSVGEATVAYDATRVRPGEIEQAVRDAGYEPAVVGR
jgi:copper ion binding protein